MNSNAPAPEIDQPEPDEAAVRQASDRIDRAIARIEAAARQSTGSHADLQKRHAALRDQVAVALAGIDSLIAEKDAD